MTAFRHRLAVILLSHTLAYVPLALWLVVEDRLYITVLIVPPLTLGLALVWIGWRIGSALGDVRAILTDRRRSAAVFDYLPGAARTQADVNRAA